LHLHNAATGTEQTVALPDSPVAVSVSPNGLRAAVAHNSKVSSVNLQTMTVEATYPIAATLGDIVLGGGNFAYCFSGDLFNVSPIYTMDLTTGTVANSTGNWVFGDTHAHLHPNGTAIYGADEGVSPDDIERYDVTGSTIAYTRDSPYHGQYPMGGDVWPTQDGSAVITRSGNVFYASNTPAVDMTYRGTIGAGYHMWITHSQALGKIASVRIEFDAMSNPYQSFLKINGDQQYNLLRDERLPDTPYNGMTYASVSRFAAFNASSTKIYVIARVGKQAPGVAHVLYTYDP
jgi:hypothetical protein